VAGRRRTRRTITNASPAARSASSASFQTGVELPCEGSASAALTSASGVGAGCGAAGAATFDWSRPPSAFATTIVAGGVTPPVLPLPVEPVPVEPVPLDELPVEDGGGGGAAGGDGGAAGGDGGAGGGVGGGVTGCLTGVTVCEGGGFCGRGIGLMSAAAAIGSTSSARTASRTEGRTRNRISAMIGQLAPGCKGRGLRHRVPLESAVMPIHLRGEPGDYADAVLLPGDPLRAKLIAETFFDNPRQVNSERGMLGYTGTFEGKPISVQSSGMGCPSAAIVIEELVQLGVKRIVRVGTCGGLQTDMQLGDLILAISAVPSDGTMLTYTGGEPHAPTADFELVHAAVHQARHDGTKLRIGPCVSSSTFYDPDTGRAQRWSERGVLGVEMEAAILFTIAALRRIQAACLLTVSDIIVEGEFKRISDDELKAAVARMTELAIRAALSEPKH
jgi:purine-nucleoside phosphorylase